MSSALFCKLGCKLQKTPLQQKNLQWLLVSVNQQIVLQTEMQTSQNLPAAEQDAIIQKTSCSRDRKDKVSKVRYVGVSISLILLHQMSKRLLLPQMSRCLQLLHLDQLTKHQCSESNACLRENNFVIYTWTYWNDNTINYSSFLII